MSQVYPALNFIHAQRFSAGFVWVFLFLAILLIFTSFLICVDLFGIRVNLCLMGFCILFLCLGILRNQIAWFGIQNNNLIKLNDRDETVTLAGKIVAEPDNRDKVQRLKFKADNLQGIILVTKNRYPEYKYNDKIEITGKLKTPADFGYFDYKNYLLKDGVYSVMDFPKVELINSTFDPRSTAELWQSGGEVGYAGILFLKQKLLESIRQNYSPPGSLIMEGTILGDSSALTNELKNQLNITGLRHIIAVSGTHVVILSMILMYLFLSMGFWRGQAFYGSVTFIWLYIILTGLPASGIRAGIMATLLLLAEKLGRQTHGERIIVLAGALMLLQNPLLLIYDVGFQLSFLAVLGLIYLQKSITEFFRFVTLKVRDRVFLAKNNKKDRAKEGNEKLENVLNMVSATLSAQIFTIPIVLYNFGTVSFVALLTNILILPIVEYLMIFGFLSSIFGVFSNVLGFIFSAPCYFFLTYFVKILEWFSQSWAIKTFENVHIIWVVILYLIIVIFTVWAKRKARENKFY